MKFEGSETALVGVNSVVAREDWHQPRIAGPRRKLVAPWNAVVNLTRKVRSSRTVKVGLSLWRGLRKQTAVRRVCVSQGRRLVCRASVAARVERHFPGCQPSKLLRPAAACAQPSAVPDHG